MNSNRYILFVFTLFSLNIYGQNSQKLNTHRISFNPGFVQIKDAFNYGLVNKGLDLQGAYRHTRQTERRIFQYSSSLGFGLNYRQGVGLMWSLKPADFYYGFSILNRHGFSLILGPYASMNFHWQIYPELQSGHLFWRSSYEIGPGIIATLPYKERIIKINLSVAVASVGSRPEAGTEEYHYSSTLPDMINYPHTNMHFGLQNAMNHLELEIELFKPGRRFHLGYSLEYFDNLEAPEYRSLIHSINLNWNIGKSKSPGE